jgi:DisA bacterial checkpoint controller nucleotide-binding
MGQTPPPSPARLRRLAEELTEAGLADDQTADELLLREVDLALRPPVHERRVASSGSILDPTTDPASWEAGAGLALNRGPVGELPLTEVRRFADGLSSWLILRRDGPDEWAVFDRPAGSERDMVVLAAVLGATLVQRHPTGAVRVVGPFGVLRWEGYAWHHEPPIGGWIDAVTACPTHGDPAVLKALLAFAVHDLGSRGIGATLIYRPDDGGAGLEPRLPTPPPLRIGNPAGLAPLRHALAQIDGAAVFDADGMLEQLGVRLVPTPQAVTSVAGYRGMRHTSARRYSHDDPRATVIVVSEDGPVSVLRAGDLVGASTPES